jgi:hypothetical protein
MHFVGGVCGKIVVAAHVTKLPFQPLPRERPFPGIRLSTLSQSSI